MTACKPNDSQIAKAATSAATSVAPDVTVSVQNGIVTLNGTVPDGATKEALDSAVKNVKGVKSVTDNTTLPAAPPPAPVAISPDDSLKNVIDSSFQAKNISGVTVSVSNGEVTLTGSAARKDLKTIMQIANESHPKKVINQLTIK